MDIESLILMTLDVHLTLADWEYLTPGMLLDIFTTWCNRNSDTRMATQRDIESIFGGD